MAVARLLVLISGTGSNLQAVIDACANAELPGSVVGVISNMPDAYGLERARAAGVDAICLARSEGESRREYDARLADAVSSYNPDYVVLAGWMRILSSAFLDRFPGRVINLHPALPGQFPGTHAIERAFEAHRRGEIEHTGVMVHLVPDEGVDSGPVLASAVVPIHMEDTIESLEARIHQEEHRLLVSAIRSLLMQANLEPRSENST